MSDILVLALVLLLVASGYAAGRLHGQVGYREGYRSGYRQGRADRSRPTPAPATRAAVPVQEVRTGGHASSETRQLRSLSRAAVHRLRHLRG